MAGEDELRELLPKMRFNVAYKKKQAYKYKKRVEAREKEMELISGRKRPANRKGEVAKLTPKKASKKSEKTSSKKVQATKKIRTPKLKVANAETGRETLKKKKARELVAANQNKKKSTAEKGLQNVKTDVHNGNRGSAATGMGPSDGVRKEKTRTATELTPLPPSPSSSPPQQLTSTESDRALLAKAICGDDLLGGEGTVSAVDGAAFIRQDPTIYPDLEFLDEYAEKKHEDVVSADQLLEKAHHFFKDLGKREQALNRVAKEHINHLIAVNRRGGDKDGFRYVVPKNVKSVVRRLLSEQKAREGVEDPEALIDPETLVSTFGGDGVAETSDKPIRRRSRRRGRVSSDFYQFQETKKWTRNAENFLKRSRPNKMLFEAKKHQRSIKNF